MARQLPPLNALRAFEAAARHLSFTRAAEELHVTQAAISHQVKALEAFLGLPLFRRFNRRLVLSEAGQNYLPALRDSFDQMASATLRLRQDDASGQLKVSTLQSFGAKWLLPRLPRFRDRAPGIDVMVSTSSHMIDFSREDFDVAIRFGRGVYPDLEVVHLMGDVTFPVCAPRLLESGQGLRRPSDLRHHTLLHDSVSPEEETPNWRLWVETAGVEDINVERGPGYSDSAMVLQAAIAGQGVALGRRSLVVEDLRAGHLVRPFGPALPTRFSYYLVCPKMTAERAKVRAFREWLLDEVGHDAEDETWTQVAS
jgi:LysR family glycine cleavage system transcriptional activator